MSKVEYGLQLYSLRDIAKKDMKEALRVTAEAGYKYVEFAGFHGNSAEDVKAWMDEFGLICSATHTGRQFLEDDVIDETIAYHKVIGCSNIIIPGIDWSTQELMDSNIDLMNRAQKKLAEHGMTLGYHNHSIEFLEGPYGKVIEDEIINRTSLELQIDTWWAYNGGVDPVEYCEKYKDRIRVIHLKDGIASRATPKTYYNCRDGVKGRYVGSGEANIPAIRQWCLDNDVLMVIESESQTPSGPVEVKCCIDYLRTLD